MIIPSIDLMNGETVQLVQGARKVIDAGDPRPIADRFKVVGEIAVVDLDAALGKGSNRELVEALVERAPCRVGGGIRDVETAIRWLDRGATKVVVGTAATPDVLRKLPRERVVAALDARDGDVVVEGWTKRTGRSVVDRMKELREYVGGFLVTFVEIEGTMTGLSAERAKPLIEAAGDCRVTVAGGVRSAEEIGELDRLGVDAQVGMGLYTRKITLADSVAACLTSDRADGLWPTVVVDERGAALGLAYSSRESLAAAIDQRAGVYQSRKRGIWVKGATSGATQELVRVDMDCDRDALRFVTRQRGAGFCHTGTASCWGGTSGLDGLERRIRDRMDDPAGDAGSYTARLMRSVELLKSKLVEEANELAAAGTKEDVAQEAADVMYFTMVRMAQAGVSVAEVERVLDRRGLKVTRRPGDAKPGKVSP